MARIFLERQDDRNADDGVRRLLEFLGEGDAERGECAPPLDVLEYDDRVEIVVDVPGVPAAALSVVYLRGSVAIVGRKQPRVCEHSVAFHLAERRFGRFARTVALTGAFDAGGARATLAAGELRVVIPRIEERRGREIAIEVTAGDDRRE